jgi:hypothetical protein
MSEKPGIGAVRKLCELFSAQRWDEALALFHPSFVAEWPQSRERMTGAASYVAVNRHYPGKHVLSIVHAHEVGALVIATIWIEAADTGQKTFVTSYFSLLGGLIARAEEYWAEPYPAPESRRPWVEIY